MKIKSITILSCALLVLFNNTEQSNAQKSPEMGWASNYSAEMRIPPGSGTQYYESFSGFMGQHITFEIAANLNDVRLPYNSYVDSPLDFMGSHYWKIGFMQSNPILGTDFLSYKTGIERESARWISDRGMYFDSNGNMIDHNSYNARSALKNVKWSVPFHLEFGNAFDSSYGSYDDIYGIGIGAYVSYNSHLSQKTVYSRFRRHYRESTNDFNYNKYTMGISMYYHYNGYGFFIRKDLFPLFSSTKQTKTSLDFGIRAGF